MKRIALVFFALFVCTVDLNGMKNSETVIDVDIAPEAQLEKKSTLPRCLQRIAHSPRVGKICAWLFAPIIALVDKDSSEQEKITGYLHQNPRIPGIEGALAVSPTTSRGNKFIKQAFSLVAVGFILISCLPTAHAKSHVWENLKDHLEPKICMQDISSQRCCTIKDNSHVSCCVTSAKTQGQPVCKSYLFEMPQEVARPSHDDVSKLKDQCSPDLTPENIMIRKEINDCFRHKKPYIEIPESGSMLSKKIKSAPPFFLKKFRTVLKNINIPADAPLIITFMGSENTNDLLDAALSVSPFKQDYYYSKTYPHGGLGTLYLRSNLIQHFSIDEIFAAIHHELGHLIDELRTFAQLSLQAPDQPHNREVFADLVSALTSKQGADQTSMLRQYTHSCQNSSEIYCETNCSRLYLGAYPPLLCRIAYLDTVQDQLGSSSDQS